MIFRDALAWIRKVLGMSLPKFNYLVKEILRYETGDEVRTTGLQVEIECWLEFVIYPLTTNLNPNFLAKNVPTGGNRSKFDADQYYST